MSNREIKQFSTVSVSGAGVSLTIFFRRTNTSANLTSDCRNLSTPPTLADKDTSNLERPLRYPKEEKTYPAYSEKFKQLERVFDEQKDCDGTSQFCYVYLTQSDELMAITMSEPHPIDLIRKSLMGMRVIAAFDLHDNFESQVRNCGFDPTLTVTWKDLIKRPVYCVNHKIQKKLPAPTSADNIAPFNRPP